MKDRETKVLHALWCRGGESATIELWRMLSAQGASIGDIHGAADRLERMQLITSRHEAGNPSRGLSARRVLMVRRTPAEDPAP